MEEGRYPVFVFDPTSELKRHFQLDQRSLKNSRFVSQVGEAEASLLDPTKQYCALFLNGDLPARQIMRIMRIAHRHRLGLPIYVVSGKESKALIQESQFNSMGVKRVLKTPSRESLISALNPILELSSNPSLEGPSTDEYVSLSIRRLIPGEPQKYDVFIRVADKKYLKILQKGDIFTPDRLKKYLDRGVEHVHILKSEQDRYIAQCDSILQGIHESGLSLKDKLRQTLRLGNHTMNWMQDRGVEAQNLEFASQYVTTIHQITEKLKLHERPRLSAYLADLNQYDHSVATSFIAAIVSKAYGMTSVRSQMIVGMASFLHDVGLKEICPDLETEDPLLMDDKTYKKFLTHCDVGSEIVREIHELDPAIAQAVRYHHVRRDSKGFPFKVENHLLFPVAEIVGIADEFVCLLSRQNRSESYDVESITRSTLLPRFSTKVVEAFRSALNVP